MCFTGKTPVPPQCLHSIFIFHFIKLRNTVIFPWYIAGSATMVMLLYSDISNFTFWSVDILKCKIFLIGFPDELGNFRQIFFYISKCKILLHFTAMDPWRLPNLRSFFQHPFHCAKSRSDFRFVLVFQERRSHRVLLSHSAKAVLEHLFMGWVEDECRLSWARAN